MTRLPILFVVLGACATEAPTSHVESPIIGGTLVTAGEFPTVVALEQSPGNWFCTGTLIGASWVLTAAHCVEGAPQGQIKIRFDALETNSGTDGVEVATKRHIANTAWTGQAHEWHDDVALIELAVPQTRPYTPLHRTSTPTTSAVTQVGYGATSDTDQVAGVLYKLAESTIDCTTTGEVGISNDEVLCFDPANGGGCYGDSGGPTFIEVGGHLEVTGITSGGTQDACSASYGIWTQVSAVLDFLDPIMAETPDPVPPMPMPDPTPDPDPTKPDPTSGDGGCSTGGSGAGLAFVGLAIVAARRRRR